MNPPVDISLATVEQAPVAARLQIAFNEEFDSPSPTFETLLPRFQALIADQDGFVLLAGDPDDPVGYAVVTLRPTVYCDGPLATLDELYVRPGFVNIEPGTDYRMLCYIREFGPNA